MEPSLGKGMLYAVNEDIYLFWFAWMQYKCLRPRISSLSPDSAGEAHTVSSSFPRPSSSKVEPILMVKV